MRDSFRGRVGFSAVALLWVTGLLASLAGSAAGSDDGFIDVQTAESRENRWYDDRGAIGNGGTIADDETPLITVRINALVLHRSSSPTNTVLTDSGTGDTLLTTPGHDPWAAGTEVDFILNFTNTTAFEFDWFSIDDWFGQSAVDLGGTVVNQVPFPVTRASSTVSSRLRNMEFNLREQVSETFTLLAGFRYLEFLDHVGAHYQNFPLGFSEDLTVETGNRLYGVQIGVQATLWKTETWQFDALIKTGMYGNLANNSSGIFSSGIPSQAANIRALGSHSAFFGDLSLRASRRFGDNVSLFVGYRLMYLDGIALSADQYDIVAAFKTGDVPNIDISGSLLLQGIEAGVTFKF
ncbi:MAG: hypothetical protein EXS05_04590 [Planctomycetaceae bacterium]|nr:hypothetical protein [Planctomycetaceae bacterium]